MQAKTYAKSDGNQIINFTTLSLEDISWLMEIDNSDDYMYGLFSPSVVAALIFCTFFWLNTLILIFTVLNTDKVYAWIEEQHKSWKNIYKASAGVLTFINLAIFATDLINYVIAIDVEIYDRSSLCIYITIKLLLVVMVAILNLLVSFRSTLKHNKKRLHKIMHALALCQIIWFGHRVATDAIISVIAFVIAPAQTLGTV